MASTTPHLATATDATRLASHANTLEAAQATVLELTTRMKQIERTLRGLVTSQALTDAQRHEILGLVTGTRTATIEPTHAGCSLNEEQLVNDYRAVSNGHKRDLIQWAWAEALGEIERLQAKEGRPVTGQ